MKTQIQLLVIMTALSGIVRATEQNPIDPSHTPLHRAAREDRYNTKAIFERFKESQGKVGDYLNTKNYVIQPKNQQHRIFNYNLLKFKKPTKKQHRITRNQNFTRQKVPQKATRQIA